MTTPSDKNETNRSRGTLYEATRLMLLAGIGAVSLAQEEINNFLDRLVERGELAETDARKLVREVMDRREKLEQERRQSRQTQAGQKAAAVTKTDIEVLNARIAELTRQIEELRAQQE